MKKEFIIKLNMIEDLKNFVHEMSYHIAGEVDAIYERQIVDAKSILGMISLGSNPIRVVIHSNDISEIEYFKTVCERYEVENDN